MNNTIHCFVTGKVQGVCFRIYSCQQAKSLGLTGWVRNLNDGRVELKATGKKEILDEFRQWLTHGPDLARVDNLECNFLDTEDFENFSIR